jgi:hypothetical protein
MASDHLEDPQPDRYFHPSKEIRTMSISPILVFQTGARPAHHRRGKMALGARCELIGELPHGPGPGMGLRSLCEIWPLWLQRLKPTPVSGSYGTAEAVP